MIVPNDTRNTKHFVMSKILFAIPLILAVAAVSLFFIMYSLYSNEKETNIALSEANKQHEYNLKLLQQDMENKQEEVNTYKRAVQDVKDEMDELTELESKINGILGNETVKPAASRGGSISTIVSKADINGVISRLNNQLSKLKDYESAQRRIPSMLPCNGELTSKFGSRSNPFGKRSSETHEGIDIANSKGTPIKAAADGQVIYSGWQNGYGNVVIIDHGNGYESFYGHNSQLKVSEGVQVKRGDLIALMGSTGRSTGPHSHFEIRLNGTQIDPLKLISSNNKR